MEPEELKNKKNGEKPKKKEKRIQVLQEEKSPELGQQVDEPSAQIS